MRATFLSTVATIILTASTALAQSEGEFPAKLAGHVVMPAATFIDAPADAPADLRTSGKYTTGKRVDALGTVMGKDRLIVLNGGELAADGPRADIITRETIRDIFEIDAVVHQAADGVPYVLPQSMRAAVPSAER